MKYLQSDSVDPHFNLALEQYVFDSLDRSFGYFMLWQNRNTVVVGKHQNTIAEINVPYVREQNISVVRRLSGGGAVYHDLGNVNFTFIADCKNAELLDFSAFCRPVIRVLRELGVHAELSGATILHKREEVSAIPSIVTAGQGHDHGTLMFDSDLDEVEKVLSVSRIK
jgi:lipoate-protein ligase A